MISRLKVIKLFGDASVGGENASEALSSIHPGFRQDDRTTKTVQSGHRRLDFAGGKGELEAKHDTRIGLRRGCQGINFDGKGRKTVGPYL